MYKSVRSLCLFSVALYGPYKKERRLRQGSHNWALTQLKNWKYALMFYKIV